MTPQDGTSYTTCPLHILSAHTVLHLGKIMRSLGNRGEPGGSLIPFRHAARTLLDRLSNVAAAPPSSIPRDILENARKCLREAAEQGTELTQPRGEDVAPALRRLDGIRESLRQLTDSLATEERLSQGETVVLPHEFPIP